MAINKIEIQSATGDIYYPHTSSDIVKHGNSTLSAFLTLLENKLKSYLPLTGGTLTGDLKIAKSNAQITLNGKDTNYYQIAHSSANGTLVFSYNGKALFTVQNNGNIIPIGNKTMSIGDYNHRISSLYVGETTGDKESGYTTLSNGYTLMWGSNVIPSYPVSTTVAETQITFPLVTKDQCFPMVSSYDIDGKLLTVRNLDANGFKVVVRNLYHDTPTWNHRVNWCCLVKL